MTAILSAVTLPQNATLSPAPTTITGVTAATLALAGPTITPTPGMSWEFDCWGQITTTVDTQTVTPQLFMGGVAGTSILNPGAFNPNSGATVTGATIRFHGSVQFQSATLAVAVMQTDLNFFPVTVSAPNSVGVSGAAQQLVFAITPSANAVSMTINGGYFARVA